MQGLQYIIDNASAIEIARPKTVAQMMTRSGRIRTAERTALQLYQIKVTPPTYSKYEDVRDVIEGITTMDRNKHAWIKLSNSSGMNYITDYRGELNSTQVNNLRVASTGSTATVFADLTVDTSDIFGYTTSTVFGAVQIGGIPNIGDTISARSRTRAARSFSTATSVTYNRAFSTARSDFLITNDDYTNFAAFIQVGDQVDEINYVTSGQTISSITYNYITLAGVGYTRIVMSAVADGDSPAAATNGGADIMTVFSLYNLVTTATNVFRSGDYIQLRTLAGGAQSWGLPRTVAADVPRGSGTTVTVPVQRPWVDILTSADRRGGDIYVGNEIRLSVFIAKLPSFQLLPGKIVQWTGDFELIERVV